MTADKKTIGITKENHAALQRLVTSGNFGSELDAAKFAMAYAIRLGIKEGRSDGADTKWNVGSVDPSGDMRELLTSLYPDSDEPYRLLEFLMNTGIDELAGSEGVTPDIYGALFSD